MRAWLFSAVILLAACSSGNSLAGATPAPSAAISPSPASTPNRTPSPSVSPAVQAFGIHCRLPLTWFPSNATPDATNSGTAFFDATTGELSPAQARPALHFLTGGPTYDAAVGKWLPVPANAVAPDGLHYAYAEWDPPASGLAGGVHVANGPVIGTRGRVHLVDARTGADLVIYSGEPTFIVAAFTSQAVLLSEFTASSDGTAASGLHVLQLTAGATPQLLPESDYGLDGGGWSVIDADVAAWGTAFSNGIGGLGAGNELVRYDFSSQTVKPWLTLPLDHAVELLGVVDHDPVVLTIKSSTSPNEPTDGHVLVLTAANSSRQIYADDVFNDPLPGNLVQDASGVWFGGLGTLWLYDGTSLRHVGAIAPAAVVDVGGPCLTT